MLAQSKDKAATPTAEVEKQGDAVPTATLIELGELSRQVQDLAKQSRTELSNGTANPAPVSPTRRLRMSHTVEVEVHNNNVRPSLVKQASAPPRPPLPSQMSTSSSSESEFGGDFLGPRSNSTGSVSSFVSWAEGDELPEFAAECKEFMKFFIKSVFDNGDLSQEEKARFGELCQNQEGRLWFARYINAQRTIGRRVSEHVFYRLMQFFAVVLFECNEADDFSPAKTLMSMCFTFYYQTKPLRNGSTRPTSPHDDDMDHKHFLYSYMREQPIWKSIRFWNAAFFDAIQTERLKRPKSPERTYQSTEESERDEITYTQNVTFGQLGTFLCNMRSFGLSKDLCFEFLRKQATIAQLRTEQTEMLRTHIEQSRPR